MDIMLDIETLGKKPGCVVLSIGACTFDSVNMTMGTGHFNGHLELGAQVAAGLTVDPDTVLWWFKQSDEARMDAACRDRMDPFVALHAFVRWYTDMNGTGIWGHGLNFDIPILEAVFSAVNLVHPWKYNAGRDTRTLFALAEKNMGEFGTPNVLKHSAHADAVFQAEETVKCIRYLRRGHGPSLAAFDRDTMAPVSLADLEAGC